MTKTYKKLLEKPLEYDVNPSLSNLALRTKIKKTYLQNGNKALIVDSDDGSIKGNLGAVFIEQKELDTEQFIKVYANGIEELANISGSGFKLFQLIYKLMIDNPNQDLIQLDFNVLKHYNKWIYSKPTFNNGLNELLSKNIIFKAIGSHNYFYNIQLFYNGDRVSIIKQYKLKDKNLILD